MPRYANITATLALFVALGGTATAAVTLERDSVTSREIAKNAVGAPEIRPEAVRSSELQDEGIRLEDIAEGAREALEGAPGPAGPQGPAGPEGSSGTSEARFTEDDAAEVPSCSELDLLECPNVQSVLLTAGSWVVHSKFTASGGVGLSSTCGLIAGATTRSDDALVGAVGEHVSLSDVITVEGPTRVAVRCTGLASDLTLDNLRLVAISVDDVVTF